MSMARLGKPIKYGHLPHSSIVDRLLHSAATTRSLAVEYGCSDSTIKSIFKRLTTRQQRIDAKTRKQASSIRGRHNPVFAEWRKKHDVWTGRTHTQETRLKQSQAKLGKPVSLSTRISRSARLQGIRTEDWTGFASDHETRFKHSLEYRQWRSAVFSRDNWTCQSCGSRGGKLHPHHIKSKAKHPELRVSVDNGVTLCAACHRKTESYGKHKKHH